MWTKIFIWTPQVSWVAVDQAVVTNPYSAGIDVVVVNYKTWQDLRLFLKSFLAHPAERAPMHCTIVNVAAEQQDMAVAETFASAHPELFTVINLVDNVGYARACNLGAQLGRSDTIALFNADIKLMTGALDACREALLEHEDWAIVGPRQVDDKRRLVHAGIFGTLDKPAHRAWHERDRGTNYTDVAEAVTVSGSAFVMKRQIWDELASCPTFRESSPGALGAFLLTPHYYEETYCAYHAQIHGYKVVYLGSTTIFHKWHAASPPGGWAEQQFRISREIFRVACEAHEIPHDIR